MKKVLSATAWRTNGHMIADAVVPLGFLRERDSVLDPTHGSGVWWKQWRPTDLTVPPPGSDFRALPYGDGTFDAIAYDPPYTCTGGRETSNIKEMYARYGLLDAPRTPEEVQALIDAGLEEMWRIVRPSAHKKMSAHKANGIVLAKCKNYQWNNTLFPGTFNTVAAAQRIGFHVEDVLAHTGSAGPQPARKTKDGRPGIQKHAAQNYSTLLVLRRLP